MSRYPYFFDVCILIPNDLEASQMESGKHLLCNLRYSCLRNLVQNWSSWIINDVLVPANLLRKTIKDATLADMKFYSKPLEGGKTMQAGKLYSLYATDVEFTTAVMLNLTVGKDGKIQECLAEKIIYQSK